MFKILHMELEFKEIPWYRRLFTKSYSKEEVDKELTTLVKYVEKCKHDLEGELSKLRNNVSIIQKESVDVNSYKDALLLKVGTLENTKVNNLNTINKLNKSVTTYKNKLKETEKELTITKTNKNALASKQLKENASYILTLDKKIINLEKENDKLKKEITTLKKSK